MTRLKNLTPHDVVIVAADGHHSVIAPEPQPARISNERGRLQVVGTQFGDVEVIDTSDGDIVGLPDPAEGTLLIVSRLVASRRPDRQDLVFPADVVRDSGGAVVACTKLGRWTGNRSGSQS